MGYSSRVHLYRLPLCSFNKLPFLKPELSLAEIMNTWGAICLTYNNTQNHEEPEYQLSPVYSRPPSTNSLEVVVQLCQNSTPFPM